MAPATSAKKSPCRRSRAWFGRAARVELLCRGLATKASSSAAMADDGVMKTGRWRPHPRRIGALR
jgi:hypothetical protein